jgi:hypothetical protein
MFEDRDLIDREPNGRGRPERGSTILQPADAPHRQSRIATEKISAAAGATRGVGQISLSGRCAGAVCPDGVFVAQAAGLQAAVKDADEAVAELWASSLVADPARLHRVLLVPEAG